MKHEYGDPPPAQMGLSPDGIQRDVSRIPFGHMILAFDAPQGNVRLGDNVQVQVVMKIWNGTKYVNSAEQAGLDVWNAVVTQLQEMRLASMRSVNKPGDSWYSVAVWQRYAEPGYQMRLEAVERAVIMLSARIDELSVMETNPDDTPRQAAHRSGGVLCGRNET